MALPTPPSAELAAIRARAVAAGFQPTQAAVLATYNRNQARAAAAPAPARTATPARSATPAAQAAPPRPSQAELNAVRSRAVAAGKKPSDAAVMGTAIRNQARAAAAATKSARATKIAAPPGELDGPFSYGGPGLDEAFAYAQGNDDDGTRNDAVFQNAFWNDMIARLRAGESPREIQESNAARFGQVQGTNAARYAGLAYPVFRDQGPEQNLTAQEYLEFMLGQYEGSDQLGNYDVQRGMSDAGKKAWLKFLATKGPSGYVGQNIGSGGAGGMSSGMDPEYRARLNAEEWRRVIEHAGRQAGLTGGRYGFGYDDTGRPLTDAEIIAAVRGT